MDVKTDQEKENITLKRGQGETSLWKTNPAASMKQSQFYETSSPRSNKSANCLGRADISEQVA